jgi:hypothetical protein
MPDEPQARRASRSHQRDHLGGADVVWKFEPIYNSPSEWNVTARWMDYDPERAGSYDVLDAMLIADEVRWRASEMIAHLFAKARTLDQVRRALTLSDCMNLVGRALSPPRYGGAPNILPPNVETVADCARLASGVDRINRTLRQAVDAQGIMDEHAAAGLIPLLSDVGELARTLYMRWYGEAGYGRGM